MPDHHPSPAIQPSAQLLPLLGISFQLFQSFCRDLLLATEEVVDCRQHGVEGNPQGGIDLVATTRSGKTIAYQCRRVQEFQPSDLRSLVASVTYAADRYYALIACRATTGVREEEQKHDLWTVWDLDDISARIRALPPEAARRILRTTFGGRWCRDFLGVQPFSAFLLPEEFFAPLLDTERVFNHAWNLVGRTAELEDLAAFVASDQLVYVLAGRGGIGKSKLLQVFAASAEKTHAVYFTQIDFDVAPESLGELPTTDTLLVIDDAHRRKDLGLLLSFAARTRTKLVLATRPQLCEEIPSLASQRQIEMSDVVRPKPLEALALEGVIELAREVLGSDFQHHAEALAAITRDCPLITVVGGRLLRDRQVPPGLLSDDAAFREAALAKFFDEIVEFAEPGSEEQKVRKLLEVIAALAPTKPNSERFARAVKTVGFDHLRAAEWCSRLEKVGVLALHEDGYRIIPDVLSDYILGTACTADALSGRHFVEALVTSVGSFDPSLLRNLAAVDWRTGRKTGSELRVLGGVWDSVVNEFRTAANSDRLQMLRDLKEVGYFLPRQMLALARLALDVPSESPESAPFAPHIHTSHAEVIAQLPEVVRFVTFNADTFDSGCDLLWELANDSRIKPPHAISGSQSALDILRGTIAYGLKKPRWVQDRLLARVESWLNIATADARRSIAQIVTPLFSKTCMDHSADDMKITTTSFAVSISATAALRSRAMQIIEVLLRDCERRVVGAAVKALAHAVEPPHSIMGLDITDEYRESCAPGRLDAFALLRTLVGTNDDPAIAASVVDAVSFYAADAPDLDVRGAAADVLASISPTFMVRLGEVVHDPWGHSRRPRSDEESQARVDAVAGELTEQLTPETAVSRVSDILSGLSELEMRATPHVLLIAIARASPDFAIGMFDVLVQQDDCVLAPHAAALVAVLHGSDTSRFHSAVSRAIEAGARQVAGSLAANYRWWLSDASQDERDIQAIQELFQMGGEVAFALCDAIPEIARTHPKEAERLLVGLPIDGEQARANKFCEIFSFPEHVLFAAVSKDTLAECVGKLEAVPQLEEWHITSFLNECGTRVPLAVIDMLHRRITREDDDSDARFTTIPMQEPTIVIDNLLAEDPSYKTRLHAIVDTFVAGGGGARYYAPRVFVLAAGNMNATAVTVLRELSARREDAISTFIANALRGHASRELLLRDATFVEQLLADAVAVSRDLFEAMESALQSCAIPRETTNDLRTEIARKAITLRDALPFGSHARTFYDAVLRRASQISSVSPTTNAPDDEDEEI